MLNYPRWVPKELVVGYIGHGVYDLLPWQQQVLSKRTLRAPRYSNLVFSAPTSSGKTVVAELIAVNTVLQLQRKAVFIFPYVSVAKEKFVTLQKIWRSVNLRVSAFMGQYSASLQTWDVAVCTIEKANSLLNRMTEDKTVLDIGVLVIDEFHMLFDTNRGLLLEQIVGKALYISHVLKYVETHVKVIKLLRYLSATLPNLDELVDWLNAEKYETQFRPVHLQEMILCDGHLHDAMTLECMQKVETEYTFSNDVGHIIQLCSESIARRESVLLFCSSKAEAEKIALAISNYLQDCCMSNTNQKLISSLDCTRLKNLMISLNNEVQCIDDILCKTIPFGIAFHHAG
ncbi:unnamed protein product [Thelazia callipaeda]|uniref:Helicase ATP-binding domain-containing protein n=1 Tax=Thelazia callipaeda TaxID=103827 RepID=A0A0N5D7Z5_THECL|nr:unnamed protein product [Thelazia callipaeda]